MSGDTHPSRQLTSRPLVGQVLDKSRPSYFEEHFRASGGLQEGESADVTVYHGVRYGNLDDDNDGHNDSVFANCQL